MQKNSNYSQVLKIFIFIEATNEKNYSLTREIVCFVHSHCFASPPMHSLPHVRKKVHHENTELERRSGNHAHHL